MHVFHHHRATFGRGGAAHTTPERDLLTAQRPLIRTDTQQAPGLHDAIESRPQMAEGVMQ